MSTRILIAPHFYADFSMPSYGNVFPHNIMYQEPYDSARSAIGNEWNRYANTYNFSMNCATNYGSNHERNPSCSRKRKRPFTIAALLGLNDDETDSNESRKKQNLWSQSAPQPMSDPVSTELDREVIPQLQEAVTSSTNSQSDSLDLPMPTLSPQLNTLNKSSNISPNKADSCKRTKRTRTIFTPIQLDRLESEFERTQYLVGSARLQLASELTLTDSQVKIWFQNRRIKERKQHYENQQAKFSKLKDDNVEEEIQSELSNDAESYSSSTLSGDELSH